MCTPGMATREDLIEQLRRMSGRSLDLRMELAKVTAEIDRLNRQLDHFDRNMTSERLSKEEYYAGG